MLAGPVSPGFIARRGAPRDIAFLTRRLVAQAAISAGSIVLGVMLAVGWIAPPHSSLPTGATTQRTILRGDTAALSFSELGAWRVDDVGPALHRFDPQSGQDIGAPVHLGGRPVSVTAGTTRLWVADFLANTVFPVDPVTRARGESIPVAEGPVDIAFAFGSLWVASVLAGVVSDVDTASGQVRASAFLPDGAVRLAPGPDGVWVTGRSGTVSIVYPRPDGALLRFSTVPAGADPLGVAVGKGAAWIADAGAGAVTRIDLSTKRPTDTFVVGGDPIAVAVWDDLIWVADGRTGTLRSLDPRTGRMTADGRTLAGVARQLVVAQGHLWIAAARPGSVLELSIL